MASAGLLDGRPYPAVHWVKSARWADDGTIVTSPGVSAGVDMSLHVAERLFGREKAEQLANLAEYERHRDPSWDPFAKLYGLDANP